MNAQMPMAQRFGGNCDDLQAAAFGSLLNRLSASLFILEACGTVAFFNQSAERHLASGALLSISGKNLMARKTVGWVNLSRVVADAANEKTDRAQQNRGVALSGSDGARAFAFIVPLDCPRDLWSIFVPCRTEESCVVQNSLRCTFDLTPMESRVASMVATGDKPHVIAAALAVSVNTVRTHLKNAYMKTGTGNQSALAAVVNELMPPVAF